MFTSNKLGRKLSYLKPNVRNNFPLFANYKAHYLHCSDFSTPVGKFPILPVVLNHVNCKQLGLGETGVLSDPQCDNYPLDSSEEASPEHGEYVCREKVSHS